MENHSGFISSVAPLPTMKTSQSPRGHVSNHPPRPTRLPLKLLRLPPLLEIVATAYRATGIVYY